MQGYFSGEKAHPWLWSLWSLRTLFLADFLLGQVLGHVIHVAPLSKMHWMNVIQNVCEKCAASVNVHSTFQFSTHEIAAGSAGLGFGDVSLRQGHKVEVLTVTGIVKESFLCLF